MAIVVVALTVGACVGSSAQEPLPSPSVFAARLDVLQLAFVDELNRPLLEQSVVRLRAINTDINALAREIALAIPRADSKAAVVSYADVRDEIRQVMERVAEYTARLPERQRRVVNEQRARQARIAALQSKGWPAEVLAMVLAGEVRIGMTADQAREAWGPPQSMNTTVTKSGRSEQWVYGVGQYLYFENGVLTAIQQSH